MIVFNETVKIDLNVHDLWLRWMKEEHVPKMMATGCFTAYKIYRILQEDETDGITYAFQYSANSITDYFNYKTAYSEKMLKESHELFPGKYMLHQTLLKEI